MRILLVNHFPMEGSGSGTYTKNLALGLVGLGHDVCLICSENSNDFEYLDGVIMTPVFFTGDSGEKPHDGALPFNFPCFTTHPASNLLFGDLTSEQMEAYVSTFSEVIESTVRDFGPDVIHGQHAWVLSGICADMGVPLVVTVHGTDLMGYDKWPSLRYHAERALDAADTIICISKDNEALVCEMFPEVADRVVLVRNGYSPAVFHPQHLSKAHVWHEVLEACGVDAGPVRRMVLFAGKLTYFKGVDTLLDAAALYEGELGDVITVIAGDGEQRQKLEAQAERLGLSGVCFLGNVSQSDLAMLYGIADVSVVPSRREPFGLVAIEAMACGTPVVATDEGGLPDFVHDGVGALVPVDDSVALSKAIVEVAGRVRMHPTWREAIALYAYENYSQDQIIDDVFGLYEEVC